MSANALPVITVHGHASNPGTVTEPTVYEQALARSWTVTAAGRLSAV